MKISWFPAYTILCFNYGPPPLNLINPSGKRSLWNKFQMTYGSRGWRTYIPAQIMQDIVSCNLKLYTLLLHKLCTIIPKRNCIAFTLESPVCECHISLATLLHSFLLCPKTQSFWIDICSIMSEVMNTHWARAFAYYSWQIWDIQKIKHRTPTFSFPLPHIGKEINSQGMERCNCPYF